MISVIFPAAGQGKRMGLGYNKIYAELGGKPIFLETMRQFINYPEIKELIIVVDPLQVDIIKNLINSLPEFKHCKVVVGGKERQDSVYNGLKAVAKENSIVLVHDAARPMVNSSIIERVVEGVKSTGAAICGMPVKDTIAKVSLDGVIESVPDRSSLWSIQTPQGFKKDILLMAHEKAKEDNFLGTDESSLVRRIGHPIKVVEGAYENIKVTTKSDMILAEELMNKGNMQQNIRLSNMLINHIKD